MSELLGHLLFYAAGALTVLTVWRIVWWRREISHIEARNAESERRIKEANRRRDTAMSALDLYRSSGKEPTGRTADILREAERSYRRRYPEEER